MANCGESDLLGDMRSLKLHQTTRSSTYCHEYLSWHWKVKPRFNSCVGQTHGVRKPAWVWQHPITVSHDIKPNRKAEMKRRCEQDNRLSNHAPPRENANHCNANHSHRSRLRRIRQFVNYYTPCKNGLQQKHQAASSCNKVTEIMEHKGSSIDRICVTFHARETSGKLQKCALGAVVVGGVAIWQHLLCELEPDDAHGHPRESYCPDRHWHVADEHLRIREQRENRLHAWLDVRPREIINGRSQSAQSALLIRARIGFEFSFPLCD